MSHDAPILSEPTSATELQFERRCRCAPDVESRLQGFDFGSLEESENQVLAVDANFSIIYWNPASVAFGEENGGNPAPTMAKFAVGANALDAIGGVMRGEYESRFREVMTTGVAWHHDYECSGPEVYRVFRQTVFPLAPPGGCFS